MKLGINLLPLYPGKIGGMEQYIRNLIEYLDIEGHQLYLFLNVTNFDSFNVTKNVTKIKVDEVGEYNSTLGKYIEKFKLDIWFCPLLMLDPLFTMIPNVVCFPDTQDFEFPEFFPDNVLRDRKKHFIEAVEHADLILTISEFSMKSIIKFGKTDRVSFVYLDSDSVFYKPYDDSINILVIQKYGLTYKYCFYPANFWPHKNHLNLLKAFLLYKKRNKGKLKLVFTGDAQNQLPIVNDFINSYGLAADINYLGYIDQDHMPYVYRNAEFLVFPSLYEGFGIPLIEAMRCDCPIISSARGSIGEVAGDAALFFDPNNPADIADKMSLVGDPDIRRKLIANGKDRSKDFSWKNTTQGTVNIFNEMILKDQLIQKEPLVSVITPSYNQGQFIQQTIESVLNQDYANIEYIVIDGGSTDETIAILNSYGNKIIWVSEKDEGQADAVNRGIRMASGEIIGWLNSDDTYLPGSIRKAVSFFNKYSNVQMLYGEAYYTDKEGNITSRYPTKPFNYDNLAHECFICQPSAFIRKNVLFDVGLLRKDLQLCMDYELWMRIGKKYTIASIPDYFSTSRLYSENKTLGRRDEVYKEIFKTVKHHYGYVPISWVYGYADYKLDQNHGKKYLLLTMWLYIKYNISNLRYAYQDIKPFVKRRLISIKHSLLKGKLN